ncbi:MAG: hypothetical protein GIW95_07215 [Candidatus Eremiobacteraeota bacterium]|nr:hypothetical protein [Candidatus Eremiobacteraeota bacterium]
MTNEEHSISTYVSDMLALERHIKIPFETQLADGDFAKQARAQRTVSKLVALCATHVSGLESCLQRLGGHEASPLKSAVTQFEGVVAGAIDKMRKTKVSKSIRDDYTALSLCAISYTMLHATATAMGEQDVAALALRHLEDYANCIIELSEAMPTIVLDELEGMGLSVDPTQARTTVEATQRAWRGSAAAKAPGSALN